MHEIHHPVAVKINVLKPPRFHILKESLKETLLPQSHPLLFNGQFRLLESNEDLIVCLFEAPKIEVGTCTPPSLLGIDDMNAEGVGVVSSSWVKG